MNYTASAAAKISEVARGLEQLRKGEPFAINGQLDRLRCDKCNRLLPERNGICPACIQQLATLKRGAQLTADIRSELYRRLEMLSLQFYDKRKVGALMSRVTRDSGRLQDFLVDGLPYLVINALMMAGILGFLFWMSWELAPSC